MKMLIAQQNILYESRIYTPGEELPTQDADMVEAWITAGTAVWTGDEKTETPEEAPEETPEEAPERTPEEAPERTPEEAPERTPEEAPEETPEEAPERTPEEAPEETPEEAPERTPVKARSATAEPGLPGVAAVSESENGENLAGRVPKTARRKKK